MSSGLELNSIGQLVHGTSASFLAYVHHIHQDKIKQKKHVSIWIGDQSVPFFKLHAWSDECAIVVRRLQCGDICCFQDISVRCFRGNKETHLTSHSFFTVLVRKNQFQDVADHVYVPFTLILPLVEWSKSLQVKGFGLGQPNVSTIKIKDLRENMLVHVLCRLRPVSRHDTVHHIDDELGSTKNGMLQQLVMVDSPKKGMILNIWHDLFDLNKYQHGALVEVRYIVVAFNSLSQSLTANTTSETVIVPAPEPFTSGNDALVVREPYLIAYDSFAEAFDGQLSGRLVVQRVTLDKLDLQMPPSETWQSALLVEGYCGWCECSLPEQNADVAPRLYGPCINRCAQAKSIRWRYRPAQLYVRDREGAVVPLHVQDSAMEGLVGHISAALVADGRRTPTGLDARETVKLLLLSLLGPMPLDIQVFSHFIGERAMNNVAVVESKVHSLYSFIGLHS